jgi:amino acid adenylation domain-containing protein
MDGLDRPAQASPQAEPFPLTDLQQAYLVGSTSAVELGNLRPNYYVELDVAGLDLDRTRRAIELLIEHHEQLRTEVLPDGTQRVLSQDQSRAFSLAVVDLTGQSQEAQEASIRQIRGRMSQVGVAPAGWPLFEIVISKIRPHRVRAHLAMSLLLLDGNGIRQVWSEWQALYQDERSPLVTAAATFRECVLDWLATPAARREGEHWRYWESRLGELPDGPKLPLARQPGSMGQVQFTRRVYHLTGPEWLRFSASVRRHQLMPAAAMLHLFAEVLAGWAASPHFCLNVLHQGWSASHPESAGVVGQFGATLPVQISAGGHFWDRGQRTQRQLWRDYEHAEVSGVAIAREAAVRSGRPPHAILPYVFTSMLAHGQEHRQVTGSRPACRVVHTHLRTPQVLIDNQVADAQDGGVDCVWDVVDDAFPPGLPDLMFTAYREMIAAIADPAGAGAVPDPVPAAHRARIAWLNQAAQAVPPGRLEHGFLRQAKARPDATAVVTSRLSLTYGQLEQRSGAVAGWLGACGIGPGAVVPVVMTKGWEQVVAVVGVLRAGAAYCPIDASLPAGRIMAMLADLSATVMLGQSHAAIDLPAGRDAPAVATLRVDQPLLAAERTGRSSSPEASRSQADLAYVIHTSGSTGTPKGVMIEHAAALNTVLAVSKRIGLRPADRVFGLSSLSFDLSVWDIFGTLAAGATLVLPDAAPRPDPVTWAAVAAEHGITVWNSVPALAEMLVEVVSQRSELARPPVRTFLLSGDWIPVPLPDRMRALWPSAAIVAMGGATEAAIWSNEYEVGRVDPAWRSIPYGTPLPNQTMRVLDHRLDLRPPWAEGGIYIGGAGLARGYWRDAERTGERFLVHAATGERLYRTGDLGRYWPDGTIEFLGREDRQAKIQGFRVEPGEVEAAIRSHPAVSDCVVCVQPLTGGQRRLVALAVTRDHGEPGPEAITAHVRSLLPHYMVPATIRLVPALPLTPNGKVDGGRALAMIEAGGAASAHAAGGSADDRVVSWLRQALADLLGLAQVGKDDDFFALGGTSLLALRLINRLRAELGVDLPIGLVFQAPTARGLAARIADGGQASCVVKLAGGNGAVLVLFHPVGGSVASYAELARNWPGPVYAFQSPELVRRDWPAETDLAAMAAGYRGELLRFAQAGPGSPPGGRGTAEPGARADRLVLAGWSMGGVLAYEVGRELAASGVDCEVIMIDSEVPDDAAPAATPSGAARHVAFLRDLAGGRLPDGIDDRLRQTVATGADLAGLARDLACESGLLPAGTPAGDYARLAAIHGRNTDALARWRPAGSGVPVLLFAAARPPGQPDPARAWRELCPGLVVQALPGDHYSLLTGANVQAIVSRACDWLTTARRAAVS